MDTVALELVPPPAWRAELSTQQLRRLTLWKWRCSLESAGFTSQQAARLLFWKWRYARQHETVAG